MKSHVSRTVVALASIFVAICVVPASAHDKTESIAATRKVDVRAPHTKVTTSHGKKTKVTVKAPYSDVRVDTKNRHVRIRVPVLQWRHPLVVAAGKNSFRKDAPPGALFRLLPQRLETHPERQRLLERQPRQPRQRR